MKLVIWDFDGTLADTRPLIEAGMDHALRRLGLPARVRETWLTCVGLPVEAGIAKTFGPLGLTLDQVLPAYRSFNHAEHENLVKAFDGITGILAELHRRGVRQAIASSKRGGPLRRQVASLGWTPYFHPLITPDEVTRAKPDPESILMILEQLAIPAAQAVMVGDTPFDLEMANRAGVAGVAVGHGFYGREALVACGPMAYAPDAAALREVLLAWAAGEGHV